MRQQTAYSAVPGVKTPALGVFLVLLGALLLGGYPSLAEEPDRQSLASIKEAAERFVRDQLSTRDENVTVVAGNLDRRLRLHQCEDALIVFLPHGYQVRTNTTVGIRCHGPKPWKIFVPVRVTALANVLVATRTLDRGASLTAADVATQEREINLISAAYMRDIREVEGKQPRRRITKGEVITGAMLEAPKLVKRGQRVTLIAGNGPVQIRMSGEALQDGAANERITVENLSSGRRVEGLVRSREIVEVLLE